MKKPRPSKLKDSAMPPRGRENIQDSTLHSFHCDRLSGNNSCAFSVGLRYFPVMLWYLWNGRTRGTSSTCNPAGAHSFSDPHKRCGNRAGWGAKPSNSRSVKVGGCIEDHRRSLGAYKRNLSLFLKLENFTTKWPLLNWVVSSCHFTDENMKALAG